MLYMQIVHYYIGALHAKRPYYECFIYKASIVCCAWYAMCPYYPGNDKKKYYAGTMKVRHILLSVSAHHLHVHHESPHVITVMLDRHFLARPPQYAQYESVRLTTTRLDRHVLVCPPWYTQHTSVPLTGLLPGIRCSGMGVCGWRSLCAPALSHITSHTTKRIERLHYDYIEMVSATSMVLTHAWYDFV